MGFIARLKGLWRGVMYWLWTLGDAVPPYHLVEGALEAKEADPSGKFYICVRSARAEVDRATYRTLEVGEALRVRYTRGNRAINIDRLPPSGSPGSIC